MFKNFTGNVIVPTQPSEVTNGAEISRADIEASIAGQNHALGRVLILEVQGCIEYTDLHSEKRPHHTPFSYILMRADGGAFITPETQLPGKSLRLDANFMQTGIVD